ncbi:IS3 family transposase [Dubosiella newyorkensis]
MKEAKKAVFEYIEGFYNTIRIHSHCGYESPMEYEKNYKILKKMRLEKN